MRCAAIHQPDYLPYPGYFYKIACADVFVFLDDAQFSNANMHNWNRIKTPQGECRLKVPVRQTLGDKIKEVTTRDELGWKERHLKTIRLNYARCPFFGTVYPSLHDLLMCRYDNLAQMNIGLNRFICESFGLKPEFVLASSLSIQTAKEQRVIDICKAVGADEYLSGTGAKAYQVPEHFKTQGVSLCYSDYQPKSYPQQWGAFLPNLSVIDYIMNCGFDRETLLKACGGSANGDRQFS